MGIQELIILMMVIGVLSMTGLWPRIIQGLRELRGESPPDRDNSAQDMEMCYRILGLSPSSSWPEIEKAYRKKAQIHHPDKGGDEDAMRVLNDVYTKLKKARRK
ncbi:MAG: DnaJ domain-containing protein [Candidatus Hydrogenedentes bacterium]|nr:DnaJ domain-containing protein [Candidatus Hydrogenedentota bacterium]